ncbi:MAG: hypothetical protein OXN83_00220 [Oligoflexia bacterium]|nr:hypothetical protein [Oligoflexia bacterium]
MRFITLVFFIIFIFSSCNPLSLDENGEGRRRDTTPFDPAKGTDNFSFPDLKDISGSEIIDKVMKFECANYRNARSFSIFGDISPFKKIQNCLAKAIDEGLKPLCEDEEKAKRLKEYHENRNDYDAVREVEEYLADLEEIKYDSTEEIFIMADEFYDQCTEWEDEIQEDIDEKANSMLEKFLGRAGKLVTRTECQGFTRLLDSKARKALLLPNKLEESLII